MKKCTKCGKSKPLSEFHRHKETPDGYQFWCKDCRSISRRKTKPLDVDKKRGTRECRMCGKMKVFREYMSTSKYNHSYCIDCRRARGLQANLERYGLTPEQYLDMEEAQGSVCAICKQPETKKKRLAIDHDHSCCSGLKSCGKCVRGLLCTTCNNGLGSFKDSAELLLAAKAYLHRPKS